MQQLIRQQSPITQEERETMDQITNMDIVPLPPQPPPGQQPPQQQPQYDEETKMGMWNFVRKGSTKKDNPNCEGIIINAMGQMIGNFTFQSPDDDDNENAVVHPKAEDILEAIGLMCRGVGKRPSVIGVDASPQCIARLQFLFNLCQLKMRDDPKKITKVLGLNVQRGQQQGGGPPRRPPPGAMAVPGVGGGVGAMGIPSELMK